MSLLQKSGIRQLSQLQIDADKDWLSYGMSQVKEVAAQMNTGDLLFFNGNRICKLTPGVVGSELMTKGPGQDPVWGFVL
jgi:hypothetical protein